jgi:IS30 family transposase
MAHLTIEQRYAIQSLLKVGTQKKEIAIQIGKHKSVVGREIKRNAHELGQYNALFAHDIARKRELTKPKHRRFTDEVKAYVSNLLQADFSPEQITGTAKKQGVECVSHETIYQFVWNDKRDKGTLHQHLRNKGRRYRKRGAQKDSRGIIRNRVDISERPAIVDQKERFGDLEIDTVIGKNHKGALLTINDRAAGYVWIRKLKGKDANALYLKTVNALMPLRDHLHTITSDNGKEFACHELISLRLKVNMYFARPYHSWERGANENLNGLIRQYFPKGCDLEKITPKQIKDVETKLNNRPRKRFNFDTPLERFQQLTNINPVALVT